MPESQYLIPVPLALGDAWPSDTVEIISGSTEPGEILARIGLTDLEIDQAVHLSAVLVLRNELALKIPGIEDLAIVFGQRENGLTRIPFHFNFFDPFLLHFSALSIRLRFPRAIFQPVVEEEGQYRIDPDNEQQVDIGIEPAFTITGEGDFTVTNLEEISITTAFMISNSGLVVVLPRFRLVLSEPEVGSPRDIPSLANIPSNFRGLWIPEAQLLYQKEGTVFPPFEVLNAAVGSGGFSGTVSLGELSRAEEDIVEHYLVLSESGTRPELPSHLVSLNRGETSLNGLEVIFQYFGITFTQSIPTAGFITGHAYMAFVDKWFKFKASVGGPDADFMLEVGGGSGTDLVDLNNDWLQIIVDSIRYELRKNEFDESIHYAIINGSIKPKIEGFDWPTFKVERLAISSEGDIELDGGWIDVPETFTLDFHGFKIDVNQLGMGNEEDGQRQWFGFSGGIRLIEGIPLSASVQGLTFSWNTDSSSGADLKVSLEGIAVHLEIPNTLILDGAVRYREITRAEAEALPDDGPSRFYGHTFTGSVTLNITALNTSVNGELLIGDLTDLDTGESFTSFYIVLNAQLPTAIPLGATGTGLYGLTGLFGIHVAPNRQLSGTEPEPWYLWYKSERGNSSAYNVTKVVKWGPRFDNFAFGAGLSLGTVYDDGFTINVGALVVILIPGPVIMIEGRANLLKQRGESSGKNAEGALYALIVFDGLAETFQMNVDINYSLEDVITVGGGMEAFFDFNDSSKWYIHIGKKDPETKRIRAEVISIVTANAYFMIDPTAFQFGAAAGINLNLEYGPLVIRLIIRLRFEIALFFKEPQITGLVELYIELTIKIFGIGIGLILQALLEGSAPQPWWIRGKARAAISLFFPLPSFDVEVEFTWGETSEPARVDLLKGAAMIHPKQIGASWALATELANAPVVPVDAIPVLSCGKSISMVSTEPAESGGIQWFLFETVEGWEFGYDLKTIKLVEVDRNGAEVEVPVYPRNSDATLSGSFDDTVGPTTPQLPWLVGGEIYQPPIENNQGEQSANNVREPQILLWQYSPLSALHPGYQERYVNLCRRTQQSPKIQCVHWQNAANTTYPLVFNYNNLWFATNLSNSSFSRVVGNRQTNRGLSSIGLTIRFPEPVTWVRITFVNNPGICISYYRGQQVPDSGTNRTNSDRTPNPYQVSVLVDAISISIDTRLAIVPTVIREICYITKRDQDRMWRGTQDSGESDSALMVDTPFLKPNTSYRLEVLAQRRERKIGETSFAAMPQTQATYYFTTAQAPGLNASSEEDLSAESQEIDFRDGPLNRLETYVARTVPQNGAKLFYRGYQILVEFNEPYVKNLYEDKLKLRVKDRNGKIILGQASAAQVHLWLNSGIPLLTPGLLALLSAPNQRECGNQRPDWQRFDKEYLSCALPDTAQPGKMYVVEVVYPNDQEEDKVLYQFQFATSGYRTITEHLESGLPHDDQGVVTSRGQLIRRGLPDSEQRPDFSWFNLYTELLNDVDEERRELHLNTYLSTEAADPSRTIPEAREAMKIARETLHQFCSETFDWLDRGGNHSNANFSSLTYSGVHQLFESIGLGHRPLPPKVELVQIGSAASGYFLLLESPEPLEWQRLKLMSEGEQLPVVWNKDQTRAFIFNKVRNDSNPNGIFRAQTYTFQFECDRGLADSDGFRTLDLDLLYQLSETSSSLETIEWTATLL